MHTLATLSLASNPRMKEEGARIISEWMAPTSSSSCSLTWLDVSGCNLGAVGLRHIVQVINVCPLLVHVNVSNNIVDGRRSNFSIADALHTTLIHNAQLTSFNVSENALWESEANAILTMFQHHSTLTSLNMQRTNLKRSGSGSTPLLLGSISSASCCSLSSLNVARNGLSAANVSMFFSTALQNVGGTAESSRRLHCLVVLILDGNVVNDAVAELCGTFLMSGPHPSVLSTLRMRRYDTNQRLTEKKQPGIDSITCAGFVALLNGARNNTCLTSIDVSGHCIRNTGCIHLAQVLFETKLKYVNVSHNRIGDRGVTPLAMELQRRGRVGKGGTGVMIELVGNPISAEIAALVVSK